VCAHINDLLREIEELYRKTPKHLDGGILGSMTTWPHEVGVVAFNRFIHVNGNDPVLFPVVRESEEKLVSEVGSLYSAKYGLYTSGGTESNILAILAAIRNTSSRVVVSPLTVHKSIDKACILMNCKLVKIFTHPLKPVDKGILEEKVREYKPSIIVITAGTTETGVVDPVEEVAEIAEKHGVYLHVDAAYGGLLIPFLRRHGLINVDLRIGNGVSSISVDMHKNGASPIPSSLLFFQDRDLLNYVCFDMDYMPSGKSCGLLGTRPGGAVIAAYYTWRAIGLRGYEENALRMMNYAKYLFEELSKIPGVEVYPYTLPIIVFKSLKYGDSLFNILWSRGLYLYKAPSLKALRVVIMPHHSRLHIDGLLKTLRELHSG